MKVKCFEAILHPEIRVCIEEISYFAGKEIAESESSSISIDLSMLDVLLYYYNCETSKKYIIAELKDEIEKETFKRGVFLKKSIFINVDREKVYFKK